MSRHHRQPKIDTDTDQQRWIISYADLLTLLFAFFVVLYGLSTVDIEKYKNFSDSLGVAFKTTQVEKKQSKVTPYVFAGSLTPVVSELNKNLDELIKQGSVKIIVKDNTLKLEINGDYLFKPGSANLNSDALIVLNEIANTLKQIPNVVQVESYLANTLIRVDNRQSTWDLSAVQATNIIDILGSQGIVPERMTALAFGPRRLAGVNRHIIRIIVLPIKLDEEQARINNYGVDLDTLEVTESPNQRTDRDITNTREAFDWDEQELKEGVQLEVLPDGGALIKRRISH